MAWPQKNSRHKPPSHNFMFNISSYLEKFKKMGVSGRDLRGLCDEVCSNLFGINVDVKNINYKNGVFRVKVPGAIKSVLFMKKDKILSEIKTRNTSDWVVEDLLF